VQGHGELAPGVQGRLGQPRLIALDLRLVDAGFWPDAPNDATIIGEDGGTSGLALLPTYAYDTVGRRATVTCGNGVVTAYGYDVADRLIS